MLARRGQPGAAVLGFLLLLLGACNDQPSAPEPDDFPAAQRPVAPLGTSALGDEDKRDEVGEAEAVMAYAMVTPGMTVADIGAGEGYRSEEHTSELQSLMRISYAVFCLKNKKSTTIENK